MIEDYKNAVKLINEKYIKLMTIYDKSTFQSILSDISKKEKLR